MEEKVEEKKNLKFKRYLKDKRIIDIEIVYYYFSFFSFFIDLSTSKI